jgi:hypothetical protein
MMGRGPDKLAVLITRELCELVADVPVRAETISLKPEKIVAGTSVMIAALGALTRMVGLIYQSVRIREVIDTATWSSLAAQLTEVDKQFVEPPELIPYFYESKAVRHRDEQYNRVYAVEILIVDFMDSATVMGDHIDEKIFEPDAWERFYEYQFKHSPIVGEIITEDSAIYGAKIVRLGRQHCAAAERAVLDPQPTTVKSPRPRPTTRALQDPRRGRGRGLALGHLGFPADQGRGPNNSASTFSR